MTGTLVVIGGHEDKEGECKILRRVAEHVGEGKLVVATVASHQPQGYFASYARAFSALGLKDVQEVYLNDRDDSHNPTKLEPLESAKGVFFSGGDQLRISSQIGDTPFENLVRKVYEEGGVVAGTSAGASAVAETMLVRGASAETHRIGDLHLAPGLSLMTGVIIDQHFAERGRIGRLLGAVAMNPRILGIGIDEDTAMVVHDRKFQVMGSGAVYILDGTGSTHSNIAEAPPESALSMFDIRLHLLSEGECFDLDARRPYVTEKRAKGA